MTFHLSPEVSLPANAATQTFAWLGTRRSGKTYGAGVFAEELLAAGVQVVIVDPVGVWYGLTLTTDGRHRRSDIYLPVLGGLHADIPLEPGAGVIVARLIAEERRSLVLDVSDFTDGQQHIFVRDLANHVFQLKKRNKSPLHLIFEEGHEFFPQMWDSGGGVVGPMLGYTKRLWKIGGNYGIGGSIVSQRAAEVNKGALNLTDNIITGRLKAPEDVKRIAAWANSNGVSNAAVTELPMLPKGTLTFWNEEGAQRLVVRRKKSFDSSKTPESGDFTPPPKLPPLDLAELSRTMASTIEQAKVEDPAALRAELGRAKAELARRASQAVIAAPERVRIEIPTIPAELLLRLRELEGQRASLARAAEEIGRCLVTISRLAKKTPQATPATSPAASSNGHHHQAAAAAAAAGGGGRSSEALPPGLDRRGQLVMLQTLAQRSPLSIYQLATLCGFAARGGAFGGYLRILRRAGYIQVTGQATSITDAGRAVAGDPGQVQGAKELLALWLGKLDRKGQRDILELMAREHGPFPAEKIAELVGMRVFGGAFGGYLRILKRNSLLERSREGYAINPELAL